MLIRSQAHKEADSKTKYAAPKLVLQEKVPGWREAGHLGRWELFSRSSIQAGWPIQAPRACICKEQAEPQYTPQCYLSGCTCTLQLPAHAINKYNITTQLPRLVACTKK